MRIPAWVIVMTACATSVFAGELNYRFDGKVSREVLENYLSRAVTAAALLHGKGSVDDNIRMLKNIGAKFAGRAIYMWGGENRLEALLAKGCPIARKIHRADPEMILQAAIFEIVSEQVNQIRIPKWVFTEFGLNPEQRNFSYEAMVYTDGHRRDWWSRGASVPALSRTTFSRSRFYPQKGKP